MFSYKNITKSPRTSIAGVLVSLLGGLLFKGELDINALLAVLAEVSALALLFLKDKKDVKSD